MRIMVSANKWSYLRNGTSKKHNYNGKLIEKPPTLFTALDRDYRRRGQKFYSLWLSTII